MNKVLLLIGILVVCFLQAITAEDDTCLLVKTTEGTYRGTTFPTGARAFLGIPFATPPLGKLRWKKAKNAPSFKGIRDAIESGPCCPQSGIFKNLTVAESEDCLTLDVYTPLHAKVGDKLPVKVYIHGGGFQANSAALVPGDQLAVNSSSVVVIINYRLSYQGFMVFTPLLEEGKGTVNYGITDQQLALEWVQRNAHQFGGDKNNVLIFGNSAGGMSVLMHYTIPSSKKLFKAGVAESPGPWDLLTAQSAAKLNDPLAARFGCYNNVTKKVNIDCLRQVDIYAIYNVTWATSTPVYDDLITQPIANTLADKKAMKKAKGGTPIIIGGTNYEGNQFAWLGLRIVTKNPNAPLFANYPLFFGILNSTLPFNASTIQAIADYYALSAVNGNYFVPLREALGDYGITCGTVRAAYNALKGLGANVYNYYFTHNTAQWRYTTLNSTHTAEIPYVLMSNGTLFEAVFTQDEFALSRQTVKYMGNFLDTLNPNVADKKHPAHPIVSIPNWPVLKEAPAASTLNWDLPNPTVIKNPVPLSCALFWDHLMIDKPATKNLDKRSFFERIVREGQAWEHSLLSKKDIQANIPKVNIPKIPKF